MCSRSCMCYAGIVCAPLTIHCLDALKSLKVPQLDGHVSWTGRWGGRNTLSFQRLLTSSPHSLFINTGTAPKFTSKGTQTSLNKKNVKLSSHIHIILSTENVINEQIVIHLGWQGLGKGLPLECDNKNRFTSGMWFVIIKTGLPLECGMW